MKYMMAFISGICLMGPVEGASAFFDAESSWDSNPRALGMGGAFTAVAEGPLAGSWNPAGLAWGQRAILEAASGALTGGGSAGGLRGTLPRIQGSAIGLGWDGFKSSVPGGAGEGRFFADAALHLDSSKRVAAGAGLRYHWGRFGGESWAGRSMDLGLLVHLAVPAGRPLSAGLSLAGLGGSARSASGLEAALPASLTGGLAWSPAKDGLISMDLSSWDRGRGGPSLRLGSEFAFLKSRLLARAGYARGSAGSRVGLGAGWRSLDWSLDYGLALEEGGGSRHQIAVSYLLHSFAFQSDAPMGLVGQDERIKDLQERLRLLREAQADLSKRADASLVSSRKVTDKIATLQSRIATLQAAALRPKVLATRPSDKPKVSRDAAKGPGADFLEGKDLFEKEQYMDALTALYKALDHDSHDPETRQFIMDCLVKIPREDLYPKEYLDLYNQGIGFNTQGAFEDEIKAWQTFLAAYPKDLRVEGFLKEAEERLRRIKGGT